MVYSVCFANCLNYLRESYNAEYDSSVDAGMLTGRPEEKMPVLQSDILKELAKLHEHARKVMKNMAKALWPSEVSP